MTTIQRGTPALGSAPPQNQNTAPVYEFECLFTHDVRKKKKTWHDGSLRFHTFNRRIMVYDDSKSFIGDLHYRDANDLNEGEELRLDKGVLVDVGRRIGSTVTDLTEVLDRGRHGDDQPQPRQVMGNAAPFSVHRLASTGTQGRPKSLAAVLGTSQGPVGRARLETKSPYQQLHPMPIEGDSDERAAKRQRIAIGKENAPIFSNKVGMKEPNPGLLTRPQTSTTERTPLVPRLDGNLARTVIDISSDVESEHPSSISPTFKSSKARSKGTKAMRNPPVVLDLAPKPPRPKAKLPSKPSRIVEGDVAPLEAQRKVHPKSKTDSASSRSNLPLKAKVSKTQNHPEESFDHDNQVQSHKEPQSRRKESGRSMSSSRSRASHSGPTSRLRFAPSQPRPKLMYRDLLPANYVSSRPGSSKSADAVFPRPNPGVEPLLRSENSPDKAADDQEGHVEDVLDISDLDEVPLQPGRSFNFTASPARAILDSPACEASTSLFVSQSPSKTMQKPLVIDDDTPVPSPLRTPLLNAEPPVEMTIDDQLLQSSPLADESSDSPPHISHVSKLTLMDQRLMMPPPLPPLQPSQPMIQSPQREPPQPALDPPAESPQPRAFRRVLSESDSPAQVQRRSEISPPQPPPTITRIPSVLNGMRQRTMAPAPEPRRPFKSPTTLQRAHSDTAAMLNIETQRQIGKTNVNVPEILDEADEDTDIGPWSTNEAFLLFDWWPPGREKPKYGRDADGFARPSIVRRNLDLPEMGFRSAGTIRDRDCL